MDEQTIDMTDGAGRAERILPGGFVPSHLAVPALRDARGTSLEYAAEGLGEIRLAADILADPTEDEGTRQRLATRISEEATRLQRLVKALAVGALALLVVGGVTLGGGGRAEAMEGPQPDPAPAVSVAARTVPVVLSARYVTVRIPATTTHVTPRGYFCASVWATSSVPLQLGPAHLGRACSRYPSFTVPVTLDARWVPLGRSTVTVTDDVSPFTTAPAAVTLAARRPSRFGAGTWAPTYYGDGLTVTASLYAYTPALGAWTAQKSSPVRVQEFRAGRWVTVATLTTNSGGVFMGSVTLGGGLHTVRVARQAGATVWSTVGTAHTFYLVPTDVPVDII